MNESNTTNTLMKYLGILSFTMPIIVALIIIGSLLQLLPDSMQELPQLLPFYICPIGLATGGISYIFSQNRLAGWGIVFNCLFSFSPILLMVL